MVNLVAVQMTSQPDVDTNISWLEQHFQQHPPAPNSMIVLPECFSYFGGKDKAQLAIAEPLTGGASAARLSRLAQDYKSTIFAGTMPVATEDPTKFSATCRCFNKAGEQFATYDKIHLFDVSISDSTGSYKESLSTKPGEKVVVTQVDGIRVGVAVCYDVRFTGLFDAMGEIDVLVLPAAFTVKTGSAHWSSLIKARAIEKQCFVVAAGQVGTHKNGRETFGNSMIVSPWGEVLAHLPDKVGSVQAPLDIHQCENIRKAMPIHEHKKFRSYFVQSS